MSGSDSGSQLENIRFDSVELLSLYTTMGLKRLTTVPQPVEDQLAHLVTVIEHNLEHMELDRKYFFDTLTDHTRRFSNEWRLHNIDGPDRGTTAFHTLLAVLVLRLGVEKLGISGVHTSMVIEELGRLYSPDKPTLSLKYLNQCHEMFEYLASHSPGLEEVYLPRSDTAVFQNCLKFKNLRVLEMGGRVSDKALCCGLWNINKKSEKVLEMALKETKGLDGWVLTLPHLKVLRNNSADHHSNSMRLSLGAAALLIQPKMETVEAVANWYTTTAIMHVLDTEAKMKNTSTDNRKFQLTRLVVGYDMMVDEEWLDRLFDACPQVNRLALLGSDFILNELDVFGEVMTTRPIKELIMNAEDMQPIELLGLTTVTPELTDLTLHITLVDLSLYHHSMPDKEGGSASPSPHQSLWSRHKIPTRQLDSLTLKFCPDVHEEMVNEKWDLVKELKKMFKNFILRLGGTKKLRLYNTSYVPTTYLVFGCIETALEEFPDIKHLSIVACNNFPWEEYQPDEDGNTGSCFLNKFRNPHYRRVRRMLPCLQKEKTFLSLCRLKSLELDGLYVSPRVDRMVTALRSSGVFVNILNSAKL